VALDEHDPEAAEREIVGEGTAGASTPDDHHLGGIRRIHRSASSAARTIACVRVCVQSRCDRSTRPRR
jgi:hypothetical protein